MPRGGRCLVAAVLATCLTGPRDGRAAVLNDGDLKAGKTPAFGDTVILSDFERCFPRSAVAAKNAKAKWWLRPYKTPSGSGKMLCVEERDMDHPQTCMAPALTYPLKLEGIYDIRVGTYRPILYGGGIDIKLTRDKMYFIVNPCEDGLKQWPPPKEDVGRLVESFWKTADLAGQGLHLRQPHGTYDSLWWGMCNAHIAYIKLIRRSPEEITAEATRRKGLERKGVVVDLDGFSWVWQYGVTEIDCIVQQVEGYQFDNVEAINWCIGGSLDTNFPHPMTSGRIRGGNRLGDKRAEQVYKGFEDRGLDVMQVLVDRCHELGVKLYASHRANVHYHQSNVWDEHPKWHLKSRRGLDYANTEARNFCRDFLLYIPQNYDVDGLTIEFSRHRQHFNPGQENQFEIMNSYLRELRAGLDRIGAERGRRLTLNASFTCGTWYDNQTPEQQGLDVPTWVEQGIVDYIMPEGRDVLKYIELCKGKKTKCYGRLCDGMDFEGGALQRNLRDPEPSDDKKDMPPSAHYSPLEIVQGVLKWYDAGASGVFLFNMIPQVPLRNLPYPEILRREAASGRPFGRILGEPVEWSE